MTKRKSKNVRSAVLIGVILVMAVVLILLRTHLLIKGTNTRPGSSLPSQAAGIESTPTVTPSAPVGLIPSPSAMLRLLPIKLNPNTPPVTTTAVNGFPLSFDPALAIPGRKIELPVFDFSLRIDKVTVPYLQTIYHF